MKRILTILLLLLLKAAVAQVDIKVSILPPYPSKVTDYASHPQQVLIMLRSMSNLAQDLQLRGTITADNGISLRVDPRYKSPLPIHLNGGQTRQLSASDISQLFDYDQLIFSGITKEKVIRGNGLPEGNYQVCVQAFNYNTNQPLSTGEPLGCSNVFPITSLEPPTILNPFNGQPVSALTTQNFPINWTTPAGAPPSTQYTVSMVEILDNRSPNDAINSATSPLFFQQTISGSNLLLYGPALPMLTPGRRYALMVTAKDPFNSVTFRNNGRSEVIGFMYGDTTGVASGGGAGQATAGSNGNLPSLTLKGRLTWYYRESEQSAPPAYTRYDPSKNTMGHILASASAKEKVILNAVYSDPSFVGGVGTAKQIINKQMINTSNEEKSGAPMASINALKSTKPTAPTAPSTDKQLADLAPPMMDLTGTGLGHIIDGTNPAYYSNYGAQAYPMATTVLTLLAVDTLHPYAQPQLAGTGTTDEQGNFQISFVQPAAFGAGSGYKYLLSVQENYFMLPNTPFSFPSGVASYDLGEVKALANTYRLLPYALNPDGSEARDGIIDVFRRADFYATHPALRSEGNLDANNRLTETIEGQAYVRISTLKDGYTGSRLFFSTGNTDVYKVRIAANDCSTLTTSLAMATGVTRPTAPQTIEEDYKLVAGPTIFSGTVSETLSQGGASRPIPGAAVTLYLTDEAYNKAVQAQKTAVLSMHEKLNVGVGVTTAQPVTVGGGARGNTSANKMPVKQTAGTGNLALVRNKPTVQLSGAGSKGSGGAGSAGAGSGGGAGSTGAGGGAGAMKMQVGSFLLPKDLISNMTQYLNGQITATTDSNGAFTFSGFPIDTGQMKFVVSVPGSAITRTDSLPRMTKGMSVNRLINLVFIAYAVTGHVVDEKDNAIPNARCAWLSGGSYFSTDANGYFATSNKAGTDTLIITDLGYQERRIGVTIKGDLLAPQAPPAVAGSGDVRATYVATKKMSTDYTANYINSLQGTSTYQQSVSESHPLSAAGFGYVAYKSSVSWVGSVTKPNDNTNGAVDLHNIILHKRVGRMLITVLDAGSHPLSGAAIQIDGTDTTELTGSAGTRYIEGPGGDLLLDISGPAGASYAPQQVAISVNETDTAKKTIVLAAGARISGYVRAAGQPVPKADISVQGLDYMHASADNSGHYTLVVPKNTAYTFIAAASGLVSDKEDRSFAADGSLDFALGNAGFNITKLLGFPVQIDQVADAGNGHKKLTGSFVNIPGNSVFSVKAGIKLSFSNVEVAISNNIPVPVGGTVTTDQTQLALKAFNFLPVKLTANGSGTLVVTQSGSTGDAGQLQGMAAIDYAAFMPSGIASYVNGATQQYLQDVSSATPQQLVVLNSSGTLTLSSLSIGGAASQGFDCYGFKVSLDLKNSSLKADGLHLKGSLDLGSVPLLSNTNLQVNDLWVGTNGYISGVSVNMDPAPGFSIGGWGATLTGLSFSSNGFSVSGNVKIQIPGSQPSQIDFANLNIATDQLYGGSFTIPSTGIDVFGVVKFMGGPVPLSFGKLGSSNVYYIGGSGSVQFPSLFDPIQLQFFQVQTNGQFAATVPTNINANFYGLAQVQITQLGFRTAGGVGVDVQGNFLLNAIPWIKAQVGGIHFNQGGQVHVDDIGISFDMVGIASVNTSLQFSNEPDKTGFSGSGAITIAGLPGLDIGFSYYRVPKGILVSANFKAHITIPIGVIASINNPGGGFSLNTGDGSWSVTISGDASITGLGTAVSIDNISVTVASGPVIKGTAGLSVMTLNIAKADLTLDFAKSLFSLTINAGIDVLPKIVTEDGSAIFVVSTAKNDTYFMLGAYFRASLLGIFNENANIAAGWGLNTANHPEYSNYTSVFASHLSGGVLSGVFLLAGADMGFNFTGDIYVASGSVWYKNNSQLLAYMDIGGGNYGIDVGNQWDCGASLSIWPFGKVASLDIGADEGFHMSYVNDCFSVGAELHGHLTASIGDCDDDCFTGICTEYDVVPVGGKLCIHPGLSLGYDCSTGFHLGLDL